MTVVHLIRHGETDFNREGRWQGQLPIGLNEHGQMQARRLAARLACEPIVAVYASDLPRAAQTAQILADALKVPLTLDPDLREVYVGDWEGLLGGEVRERFPDEFERWVKLRQGRPGGGEDFQEAQRRMVQAVDAIVARHPGQAVAVVSHGFVIKAFICYCLELPPTGMSRFVGGNNTSINVVEYRDGARPRLLRLNDEAHLEMPCPPTEANGAPDWPGRTPRVDEAV
jgi:probable phosphoglycerate mutase